MASHTYEAAVARLYTLQSNQAVIDAWKAERLSTKTVDLREGLCLSLCLCFVFCVCVCVCVCVLFCFLFCFSLCCRQTILFLLLDAETLFHLSLLGVSVSSMRVLHVAGTKGKGSVSAFAESLARSHGLSTGLFVSPHLVAPRERIRLAGRPISEELFAHYFFETLHRLERGGAAAQLPPFFRFLNCMALLVFQEEKVQCAIVEVGVGGRTCSTNVVSPDATVITRLGYDHMDVLGPTLTHIAFEKAGIMKPGVVCFSALQEPEPKEELERQAVLRGAAALHFVPPLPSGTRLGLDGEHQRGNAALAVAATRMWMQKQNDQRIKEIMVPNTRDPLDPALSEVEAQALATTRWPGRAQQVMYGDRTHLFLDGAHTAESASLACEWFKKSTANSNHKHSKKALVCNFKPNKQVEQMMEILAAAQVPWSVVVFTPSAVSGSHDCSWQRGLAQQFPDKKTPIVVSANLTDAMRICQEHGATQVLVTGSLYLVGAALEMVKYPVDEL